MGLCGRGIFAVAAVLYVVGVAFSWEDFYLVCTSFHSADTVSLRTVGTYLGRNLGLLK